MLWYLFAIRLVVALFFGALVGAERHWRQRMAGLRTNALVAAGAAMFVMLSALAAHSDDSFRIAGQVVSGIGFLGAGVILRNGLNTDKVEVHAILTSTGRQNSLLEQIVSRLSLEPGVTGVSWEIIAEHE